jgi:xanthine dehydrogenase/oxidase
MVDDIPGTLNVTLLRNVPNASGILSSKAVGEPPYIISNSVYFATKMAIQAARNDAGKSAFVDLPAPATVDLR